MSIRLTKRIASDLLGRGESAIRIKETAVPNADKAITREDVRQLIKKGDVYALAEKRNVSTYSKVLRIKRAQGRRRGPGAKKGTRNARSSAEYKKKVRGQRRVLLSLKADRSIDNLMFKQFYKLVRGGTFESKAQLLSHIKGKGVSISDEKFEKLRHI
ncbi:MAG: hypothetical protein LVQ95_02160 [Candidatus Micrarchaeales archaeon]|nr:hypothetical protein [Candidatus Micrarchaeales archaeon]